ncbi:hypothetical protein GH714_017709 [Hevea brasiliensis]|uniref:R13L1/DRL21-like LRR repeat region domain-containing protein n=1 Tax=Hevea brasiliensis TaxID=3981 RepID=A0A6A6N0L2_HEVBR|nr:hypothetical protein GH714_017709 [Hevea brasiliensis]
MPPGLGQLTSLRTLTWFVVAKDNSVAKNVGGLTELNSLNNLRGSLEITDLGYVKNGIINPILKDKSLLQSLSLSSDRDDDANVQSEEMAFQNLQPHPNLKELKVYSYRGTRFPSWVSSLTNLVNIKLLYCRCQHLPPLDQIPSLQMLEIWALYDLEYIEIEGQATVFFPSLKYLKLRSCLVPPLSKLKQLKISDCPRLTSLPQEMRSLASLRELIIERCPLLSKRCANKKGEDWPFISHIPNIEVDDKKFNGRAAIYKRTKKNLTPHLKDVEIRRMRIGLSFCHSRNLKLKGKEFQWDGHYVLEDEEKSSTLLSTSAEEFFTLRITTMETVTRRFMQRTLNDEI